MKHLTNAHIVVNCGMFLRHDNMPKKMLRHFPLIPWLKQMSKAPHILKLMKWHDQNKSKDGYVQHDADSRAWAHIDSTWPTITTELHNLRLRLALDEVNPFKN